ncbi:MAG: hypothetical protein ACI8UD_000531 [Planctomycetota bacterium]|jgi:hypothetical protein
MPRLQMKPGIPSKARRLRSPARATAQLLAGQSTRQRLGGAYWTKVPDPSRGSRTIRDLLTRPSDWGLPNDVYRTVIRSMLGTTALDTIAVGR